MAQDAREYKYITKPEKPDMPQTPEIYLTPEELAALTADSYEYETITPGNTGGHGGEVTRGTDDVFFTYSRPKR